MFLLTAALCFYNTHHGLRVQKISSHNGTRALALDGAYDVIEVGVDIANATKAPNTGYFVTIPGGQRFWTHAIRANYICGSGKTYRYSEDIRYTTTQEPDAAGVVLVTFIGILITIAFCVTWPILLAINGKLHRIKKDIGRVGGKIDGVQRGVTLLLEKAGIDDSGIAQEQSKQTSDSSNSSKHCRVSSAFAYTWMCITGVILLFIGIVASQLVCSMMGWRNLYRKKVTNKCFYVDRSAITEDTLPAEALRDALSDDSGEMHNDPANIIDDVLVSYNDVTDTAVFLMGTDTSKYNTRDMYGNNVTYLFIPPVIEQGRIGDDNCSTRVTMYKITGVDVEDYTPAVYSRPLARRKCYDTPTPTGVRLSKCKSTSYVSSNTASTTIGGMYGDSRILLYDTADSFNSTGFDIGDNEVLRVLATRDEKSRKYGYCADDGCINSRIYMRYKAEKNTWHMCRRPPVQNITTPGSVTILVSNSSDDSASKSLPADGWEVPISKTDSATDEYYTDGISIVNKQYSGYTRDNEYNVRTLFALFRKTKSVNVSVKFDYIGNTLYAHDDGEHSLEGSIKLESEIVGYLKDKALSSLAATNKGIYSSVWRKQGDAGGGISCIVKASYISGYIGSTGVSAYTLHNASSYGAFVNRSCNSVHAYINGTRTFIETADDTRCIVPVAYDTVNAYITLSAGAASEITGAGSWRCKTDDTDSSRGVSCSTDGALNAFTPLIPHDDDTGDGSGSAHDANTSSTIGIIPPDVIPSPYGDKERRDAAGDTNISESNIGEVNNKASTSSALIIVAAVVIVVVIVVVVIVVIVYATRKKDEPDDTDGNEMRSENDTVDDTCDRSHGSGSE